jgi:hypothetical protein
MNPQPQHPELERTPEARALAEQVLVALLHSLDDAEIELVVLGGLVPETLTRGQEPPAPMHMGTTDVDILLVTHVTAELDLGSVEMALTKLGFEPEGLGWRWRGRVRERTVKIEFLCDLANVKEGEVVKPPGCKALAANNLRGTGYVALDWAWEAMTAELPGAGAVSVRARFARLGGYLLSKCVAARTRAADKDFYDLVYVLLHNRAGGPAEAAVVLLNGPLRDALPALRATLIEVSERFRGPNDTGPTRYAQQARLVEPGQDDAELRADAVAAVGEFVDALFDASDAGRA